MKTLKILAFVCLISNVNAQISIETQGNIMYPPSASMTAGLGLNVNYSAIGNMIYTVGFNYYGNSTVTVEEYFNSGNSSVTPGQIKLNVDYTFKSYDLHGGIKHYIIGSDEDEFGIYGIAGAGIYYAPVTAKVPPHNKEYEGTENGKAGGLFAFTGHIGIGLEKSTSFGALYARLKGTLPLENMDGSSQALPISSPLLLDLGIGVKVNLF